jgi:hypothetical protein
MYESDNKFNVQPQLNSIYNKNYLLLSFILRIIIEIMLMIAATAVGSIAAVVVSGGGSNSFIYFIYSSA